MKDGSRHRTSPATLLVALGIIYGDIGTSPLYVLKAIVGVEPITSELVLGGLSCIFWTITLLTTFKYVTLVLQADNNGEGGTFSLYALVRRSAKWLIFPALIGGSALLADGIITPPISVSSAVEGLQILHPHIPTVPIVLIIILLIFSVQQFGTKKVGRSFGPVMLVWFLTIAIMGLGQVLQNPSVLLAFNPLYGYRLLFEHPEGFWLLGAVFLCTTGAEALYSDLGHCGRKNIRISWTFVKTCLLLNYAGQSAWLLQHEGMYLDGHNPFYLIMPRWFLVPGILIATCAAVVASQAMISGAFTLVTEAIRLYLFPKTQVVYPTELKGQVYVPAINRFMFFCCVGVVLYFQHSSNMEGAYGFAIIVTMLSTTVLFAHYLMIKRVSIWLVLLFFGLYMTIEAGFLIALLSKFTRGGWVTFVVGTLLGLVMWCWHKGSLIKRQYTQYLNLNEYLPTLQDLSADTTVPKFCTHLVYLTGAPIPSKVESKVIYSIFQKQPKRADVYWFLHVDVLDEPYTLDYKVETLIPGRAVRIDFMLGFRVEPRISSLFRKVVEDLARNHEIDLTSRYESLRKNKIPGDFRFVVLEKTLPLETAFTPSEQFVMEFYFFLKNNFAVSEERSFGLDTSSVITEKVPLVITPLIGLELRRVY